MKNMSSPQVAALPDDQAMFDSRFLEENSEFFRIDPYQNYSLLIVHLDLLKAKANLTRIGKDMHNLKVRPDFNTNPYGFQGQQKPGPNNQQTVTTPSSINSNKTNEAPKVNSEDILHYINTNNVAVLLKTLDLKVDEKEASVSFSVRIKTSF